MNSLYSEQYFFLNESFSFLWSWQNFMMIGSEMNKLAFEFKIIVGITYYHRVGRSSSRKWKYLVRIRLFMTEIDSQFCLWHMKLFRFSLTSNTVEVFLTFRVPQFNKGSQKQPNNAGKTAVKKPLKLKKKCSQARKSFEWNVCNFSDCSHLFPIIKH